MWFILANNSCCMQKQMMIEKLSVAYNMAWQIKSVNKKNKKIRVERLYYICKVEEWWDKNWWMRWRMKDDQKRIGIIPRYANPFPPPLSEMGKLFLHTSQMILSKNKILFTKKKLLKTFFNIFFSTFFFTYNHLKRMQKKIHKNRSKKKDVRKALLRAQAPDAFGLNTRQLVIGYHWLSFLNQVLKQFINKNQKINFLFVSAH